ncbi:hypothetical protein GCM10010269_62190 [Streptomyces humidus]|uniref:Uncharacterized protein n=1 Tax=Streptomyces humidus TaxID=52259 RepID=A0A918L6C8_9ACTN|nr:hypothetical protein GCM10010269_62190 [Streptomyces humidus]
MSALVGRGGYGPDRITAHPAQLVTLQRPAYSQGHFDFGIARWLTAELDIRSELPYSTMTCWNCIVAAVSFV